MSSPEQMEDAIGRARAIAETVSANDAEHVDGTAAWPERSIRALQEAGLGGLVVPVEMGGLGLGLEGLARVGMELGKHCGSTGLCFGMHCVGSAVIASKATDEQQRRYLDAINAGTHLTTLALSEPGTGVHFYLPETRILAVADGYQVFGRKCFVTNGGHADSYVMSAQEEGDEADLGAFSCFLMPNAAPGIAWQGPWTGLGMRGNSSRTVTINGLHIPSHDRLGDEGDQNWYIFQVVAPYFLISMAGTYLGIATGALEAATEHLKKRRHAHHGRSLAQVDILQHRVGELWARLQAARAYTIWAAQQGDQGTDQALPALIASKALVGDVAVDIVNEAMTLVGGQGYRDGTDMERRLRDVRAVHVMSPTTDILYTWAGRALLGEPLLGE